MVKRAKSSVGCAHDLVVEAQQVVQWLAETGDGRAEFKGVVRTVPVGVVEEDGEAICALSGVVVDGDVEELKSRPRAWDRAGGRR